MQANDLTALDQGPDLPKISGTDEINHVTIQTIIDQSIEYLTQHPSSRGGGNHGHLQILTGTDNAFWNELTNNAPIFQVPIHPGTHPNIPQGATQHVIAQANREHQVAQCDHSHYNSLERNCKRKMLSSVHPSHYYALSHSKTKFANVKFAQIVAHLRSNHGTPTRDDLDNNKEQYDLPHDLNETVKMTFMKKKQHQQFAAGTRAAISDDNLIQNTITAFKKTGCKHFLKAIRDFDNRPILDQTWGNLQKDMEEAEKLRKNDPETSEEAGYANKAAEEANRAMEEATDTKENVPPKGENKYVLIAANGKKFSYCFTHGLVRGTRHNSQTCNEPCSTHKRWATVWNMGGGLPVVKVPETYKCLVTDE